MHVPESMPQTDTTEVMRRPPTARPSGWLDSRRSILAVGAILVVISSCMFLIFAEANVSAGAKIPH